MGDKNKKGKSKPAPKPLGSVDIGRKGDAGRKGGQDYAKIEHKAFKKGR